MNFDSGNYEDKWSNTPTNELLRTRPTGVTILAVLQIIGIILSIILIFAIPILFKDINVDEIIGVPIILIMIIYTLVSIPIALLLTIGLLKGEIWARNLTLLFQYVNIITSLMSINLFGVIFPIIIISYLKKQYVKDFFDRQSVFYKKFKILIISLVIIMLVFSFYTSFLTLSLRIDMFNFPNDLISEKEEQLVGTWHNADGTIVIIFRSDHSCSAINENITYSGTWHIDRHFYFIEINWYTDFKIKHPNDPSYYYPVEQVFLIGDELSLYDMFGESSPYYICQKIS